MTQKQLGLKLKKLRLLKGWSQDQLAQRACSTVTRISELELGKSNITLTRLIPITNALSVDIELVKTIPTKENEFDNL